MYQCVAMHEFVERDGECSGDWQSRSLAAYVRSPYYVWLWMVYFVMYVHVDEARCKAMRMYMNRLVFVEMRGQCMVWRTAVRVWSRTQGMISSVCC
jgi:hypothetical protein